MRLGSSWSLYFHHSNSIVQFDAASAASFCMQLNVGARQQLHGGYPSTNFDTQPVVNRLQKCAWNPAKGISVLLKVIINI